MANNRDNQDDVREGYTYSASSKPSTDKRPKKKCHECGMEQPIAKKNCEGCGFVFEKKPKNVGIFKTMPIKNVTRQRQKLEYRADILHHQHDWDIVILMVKKHGGSSTLSCYATEGAGAAFIGCAKGEASEGGAVTQQLFQNFVKEYKDKTKKELESTLRTTHNPTCHNTSPTTPLHSVTSSSTANSPPMCATTSSANLSFSNTSSSNPLPSNTSSFNQLPSNTSTSDPLPSNTSTSDPLPSNTSTSDPLPSNTLSSDPLPSNTSPSNPLPSVTSPSNPLPSVTSSSNPLPSVTSSSNPLPSVTSSPFLLSVATSSFNPPITSNTSNAPQPNRTQPAMVLYVANGSVIAGGFPLPSHRTLHEKPIPLGCTCVMITSTQDNCPAPIVLKESVLEKGKIYALPNASLKGVFQTGNQLRMCPYYT